MSELATATYMVVCKLPDNTIRKVVIPSSILFTKTVVRSRSRGRGGILTCAKTSDLKKYLYDTMPEFVNPIDHSTFYRRNDNECCADIR